MDIFFNPQRQDIEFVDKSGQFYQFIMLFTVMNIRIVDMFGFKNITLKINLKKKFIYQKKNKKL